VTEDIPLLHGNIGKALDLLILHVHHIRCHLAITIFQTPLILALLMSTQLLHALQHVKMDKIGILIFGLDNLHILWLENKT